MILGWIQVDRMMVVGLGMDVVVILDINEYGGLLLQLLFVQDDGGLFFHNDVLFS